MKRQSGNQGIGKSGNSPLSKGVRGLLSLATRSSLLATLIICVICGSASAGSFPNFSNGGGGDWTTGYYRPISITNSTASALTDYQVVITLTTAVLGNPYTHIKADGSDIRFSTNPPPYSNTELSYWVESWNNAGNSTIWLKVPTLSVGSNSVYMCYGNISATASSNMDTTFVASDLTTFTKVDPNSVLTVNSASQATFTNLYRNGGMYLYKQIPSIGDFCYDFEYNLTGGSSSANNDGGVNLGGLADSANIMPLVSNGLFVNNYAAFHISTYRLYMYRKLSGTLATVPPGDNYANIGMGTLYYIRITRIGTQVTMGVYSDAARTTNVGGSPRTDTVNPAVAFNYVLPVTADNSGGGGCVSGYVQNVRLRKYASPEPTAAAPGAEAQYSLTKCVQSANWTSIVKAANPVAMGNAVAVISFTAVAGGTITTAHWRRFRIDETGGQPVSKLTVSVYEESGNDGFFDAADKFIASGTFNSNRTCYLNMNRWPLGTTAKTYYIVEKVALDASGGQTIRLNIVDGSYFDFEEGPCIGVPP